MIHHETGPWNTVTRQQPCPICAKPDWCSVSEDGQFANCRREPNGAVKEKTDTSGATYYVHSLRSDNAFGEYSPPTRTQGNSKSSPVKVTGQAIVGADASTLDKVYRDLLSRLTLADDHRAALRQRGLSDDDIARGHYVTLSKSGRTKLSNELFQVYGETLLSVPGFARRSSSDGQEYLTLLGPAGLIIPVRDAHGHIVALKVRRDDADIVAAKEAGYSNAKYLYLSSSKHGGPGSGAPVHVPVEITGPGDLVRVTVGELKADVATARSGIPTISMPGVGSWRAALDVAKNLGAKTIRLAFDADAATNPNVARHLRDCSEAIAASGLILEFERWPLELGKGIDAIELLTKSHRDAGGTGQLGVTLDSVVPQGLLKPEYVLVLCRMAKTKAISQVPFAVTVNRQSYLVPHSTAHGTES